MPKEKKRKETRTEKEAAALKRNLEKRKIQELELKKLKKTQNETK